MDYHCAKFGDCIFSDFAFIEQTNRQNHRQTDADDRYTHATLVGSSVINMLNTLAVMH